MGGEEHIATVEEKAKARETYDSAREVGFGSGFRFYLLLEVGIGAGIVSRDTEDTSLFSVATNVPGQQEVDQMLTFCLFYKSMLPGGLQAEV